MPIAHPHTIDMQETKAYATKLANDLTKITLQDFFQSVHQQFCSDLPAAFVEEFVQWIGHEDEFIVHDLKLDEYGIIATFDLDTLPSRLLKIGLKKGVDYIQRFASQTKKAASIERRFDTFLTPTSFKRCLMTTHRMPGQALDPIFYSDTCLRLERVYKLYLEYERAYSAKMLDMRDHKMDQLLALVQAQSATIEEQSIKINELLEYGGKVTDRLDQLIERSNHTQVATEASKREGLASSIGLPSAMGLCSQFSDLALTNIADQATHLAILKPIGIDGRTILSRGKSNQVDSMINRHGATHKLIVRATYDKGVGNPILHAKNHFEEARNAYLAKHNSPIIEHNQRLRQEILDFNKEVESCARTVGVYVKPRSICSEKLPLMTIADIPIKFMMTYISYAENSYISYNDLIQMILSVDKDMQLSLMAYDLPESEHEF